MQSSGVLLMADFVNMENLKKKWKKLDAPMLEIITAIGMLVVMSYLFIVWSALPTKIPGPFGILSQTEYWGARSHVLLLGTALLSWYVANLLLQYKYLPGMTFPDRFATTFFFGDGRPRLWKTQATVLSLGYTNKDDSRYFSLPTQMMAENFVVLYFCLQTPIMIRGMASAVEKGSVGLWILVFFNPLCLISLIGYSYARLRYVRAYGIRTDKLQNSEIYHSDK